MKTVRSLALAGAATLAMGNAAQACENTVPIASLTNAFPAYITMTNVMAACGNFEAEHDRDHRLKLQPALSANPSLYQIAGVANASSVPLLAEGLLRPLDDLVERFGQDLNPGQFVRFDGQIMAIAALVNTQHLMYRSDIFEELGLEVPTTWAEVKDAAEAIRAAGVMEFPVASYYRAGWDLGFVFVNHYLGNGGTFFDDDRMPTIQNDIAIATLEEMKALAAFMDPEYLTCDTTCVTRALQQGTAAIAANLWASRAGAVNDPNETEYAGKIVMAGAPMGTTRPAATLWWDGWVVARNTTEEQAEAGFRLIVESMSPEVIAANNDQAIWLAPGFTPGPAAVGAIATAEANAVPYPASPEMSLLHDQIGSGLAAFMTGQKTAEEALGDIVESYMTAAREAGLVR